MTDRNYALEKKIAKLVFGHETEMLNIHGLMTLYLVDKNAERTPGGSSTKSNLLGGHWWSGITEDGTRVDRYCRVCPAWSMNLVDAWELAEYCDKDGSPVEFSELRLLLHERSTLLGIGRKPEDAAKFISECIVDACELSQGSINNQDR